MEEKRKVEGLLIAEKLSEILARHKIPIQDSESLLIGDEILNLFYEELSKAREEVLLELLEKKTNYKIEEVGHGYKVTQEYVLVSDIEKDLSKLLKEKGE